MRRKLIRKKIKMFTAIISVFLIISIVVSGIYIYITYKSEKELLYNSAQIRYDNLVSDFYTYNVFSTEKWHFYNTLNMGRTEQTDVIITADDGIIRPSNVLAVDFASDYSSDSRGFIFYDDFRGLLTDEQYEEITGYLNSRLPEKDEKYYELVCTEFYEHEIVETDENITRIKNVMDVIYPKTIQIVLTEETNDWYAQDEVVESYEFYVTPPDDYVLKESSEMFRNVIDTNFVLGKYEECDIVKELENHLGVGWNKNPEEELFKVDDFTYIFYKYDMFTYAPVDDNIKMYDTVRDRVEIQYAEKFNVIEHCINRIGVMFIYTLLLFLLSGIIVAVMSWLTVKKQIKLEEKRRDMINSMAHDLKTPLFIISGYAENLIECVKTSEERSYANAIVDQTNSMNEMIYTMLDLSRMNADDYTLVTEIFNLAELVSAVLLNYNNFHTEYIIGYVCEYEAEIIADKKLIECVIRNFIENALKYTDDKNSVNIVLEEHKFSISNSISKDTAIDIKHIWEFGKHSRKKSNKSGNGLGLSLAKSVLEMHKFKYKADINDSTITFSFKF